MDIQWAAALAFAITSTLILLFIPLARRSGLVDHPTARKQHKDPTPVVGGLAIFFATLATLPATGLAFDTLGPFAAGSALLIVVGVIDDFQDLGYRVRFVAQAAAAAILVFWGGLRIDSLGNLIGLGPIDLGPLAEPFTVFAVVGLINAINMLDGVDGLAGGISLAILLPVIAFSGMHGMHVIAGSSILLAASIFAFLMFNYRFPWREKARVFMGDAGSNFIGYALAWIVLLLLQHPGSPLSPIALLWVVGFPVADTLATMWRRRRKGLSPFHPGHDHVHYVLQRVGFGVNATVLIVAGFTAFFTLIALIASTDNVAEPLLTLGFLSLLAIHNYILTHAWRVTKKFRHLLTTGHSSEE